MIGAQRRIATAVALSATLVAALPASAAGPAEHVLELLPREDHDLDPSSGAGEP